MYLASYSAVRILSLIPPSTLTYVRTPPPNGMSLIVPTSYRVTVPGPAIARPGSTVSRGRRSPASRQALSTVPAAICAIAAGSAGRSPAV